MEFLVHSIQRRAVVWVTLGKSGWLDVCESTPGLGHCLYASHLKNLLFSMLATVMKKGENQIHLLEKADWLSHIPASFLCFGTSGTGF